MGFHLLKDGDDMTGQEIKERVEKYIDDEIETSLALEAINEAIDLIGDKSLIFETVAYSADANTWYLLPVDATMVTTVTKSESNNLFSPYDGYKLEGKNILFLDEGTFNIHYRRLPFGIAKLSDTPEIHKAFHQCLVTYLKAWIKLQEDDESLPGSVLMQQFDRDVQLISNNLKRSKNPVQWQVVRHA